MCPPSEQSAAEEGPERGARVVSRGEFPCANCGAPMRWDPEADSLACEYCGHVLAVPRGEGTILERALEEAGAAARGFGLALAVTRCATCGASVTFEGSSTAEACVWCGSASVLAQECNRNALRPESLVPLDLGRAEVGRAFERWLHGLWFRPGALRQVDPVAAVGIYVPFWTFDCEVHSDWSADAGYYYYVTETYTAHVNGKSETRTRQVQKVRWVPAWGSRDDSYDDLSIPASAGMSSELLAKLGDFDLRGLVPYKPEYLSGWRAEEYSLDLEAGWKLGQARVEASQRQRCSGEVPGDTQRGLRVQNRIRDVRWKHVLLPVWSLQYRFQSKTYTVLVHGQSGQVAGEAPLSWWKIGSLVLGIAAAIAIAVLVTR